MSLPRISSAEDYSLHFLNGEYNDPKPSEDLLKEDGMHLDSINSNPRETLETLNENTGNNQTVPNDAIPAKDKVVQKEEYTMPFKKLHHLDGLRGWASICVFVGHLGTRISPFLFWNSKPPFYSTASVVTKIFLGTGVLGLSFLKSKDPRKLASAAVRRPFRLVIPVYVALVFYSIFNALDFFNPNIERADRLVKSSGPVYEWFPLLSGENTISFTSLLFSPITLFLPPYTAVPPSPNLSVYWTLPIEFNMSYFVFIFALLTEYLRKSRRWIPFLLVIVIDWLNSFNSWISPFAMGLWIAQVAQSGWYEKVKNSGVKGFIFKTLLLLIGLTFVLLDGFIVKETRIWFNSFTFDGKGVLGPHENGEYFQMAPATIIPATCLMLILETSPSFQWIFGNPISAFFGRISFGVYLLHPTIVVSLGSFLVAKYFDPSSGFSTESAIIIVYVTILAALIPLSWIFYHIGDLPSIRIGRWFESFLVDKNFGEKNDFRAALSNTDFASATQIWGLKKVASFRKQHIDDGKWKSKGTLFVATAVIFDLIILLVFLTLPTGSGTAPLSASPDSTTSTSFKSLDANFGGFSSMRTMVTLGDSWTDTAFDFSVPPTIDNPVGAFPRFNVSNYWGVSGTNGPNWVYFLTAKYNKSRIVTYNMASAGICFSLIIGAIVDKSIMKPFRDTVLDMKDQVNNFVTYMGNGANGTIDPSLTMAAIMLGANDVGNSYDTDASKTAVIKGGSYPLAQLYPEIIAVYISELIKLHTSGIRTFFVMNTPPLDRSPNSVSQGSKFDIYRPAIDLWKKEFRSAIERFRDNSCPGCSIFYFDFHASLNTLLDPKVASTFGVKNVAPEFCQAYSTLLNQPFAKNETCPFAANEYFWLNIVHPTSPVMDQLSKDMGALLG